MIDFLDSSQNAEKPLLPCPSCSFPVSDSYFFCPNCGKALKLKPPTLTKQISFFIFCVLLPPFGLIPSVKYLIQNNPKSRTTGAIGVALTVISLIITIILTVQIVTQLQSALTMQQDVYKQLGY